MEQRKYLEYLDNKYVKLSIIILLILLVLGGIYYAWFATKGIDFFCTNTCKMYNMNLTMSFEAHDLHYCECHSHIQHRLISLMHYKWN